MKRVFLFTAALSAVATASAGTIYSSNFGASDTTGFTTTDGSPDLTTSPSNTEFLLLNAGDGTQTTDTLTLTGVAAGVVTVDFDLYALESLDGNGSGYGPDYFTFAANGIDYVDATFAQDTGNFQGYSLATPLGGDANNGYQESGADTVGALDYGGYGDSEYNFGTGANPSFSFAFGGGTLSLTFDNGANQTWSDEGFGINDVVVSNAASSSTPAPAALASFAFGALATRRRRK
jgi:MYXO-CTERM domain-containing protein